MRIFGALLLEEEDREKVRQVVNTWKERVEGEVRWIPEENWHWTLHFFGEVKERVAEQIAEIYAGVLQDVAALEVRVEGWGAFPEARRPRVLFLEMQAAQEVRRLKEALDRQLRKHRISWDVKPFRPHLTVARVRGPLRIRDFAYAGFAVDIRRVALMQSILRPTGAKYYVFREYHLQGVQQNARSEARSPGKDAHTD